MCHLSAKTVDVPTAEMCRCDGNLTAGRCFGCSFCALPSQTAYATIVYGTQGGRGIKSACSAVVLGQAIKSLDPGRDRIVVVDPSVSHEFRSFLARDGLWSIFEHPHKLDIVGRKTALWTLPYRRVLFMDADIFPIQGNGEGPAAKARRQQQFAGLWRSRGKLVATRDMGRGNENGRCLNGGLMMLEPNQATVFKINAMVEIQRNISVLPQERRYDPDSAGHVFEHCRSGNDQPPLNAAFRDEWAGFNGVDSPISGHVLGPLMNHYCSRGGTTTDQQRRFYWQHPFYHAWARTTPLDIGDKCSSSGLATQGCILSGRDNGMCQGVHTQYAYEWWTAFNQSMTPLQQQQCLSMA